MISDHCPEHSCSGQFSEWVGVVMAFAGEDMIATPRELLESLVDDESCWLDHQGGCQVHGYLSLRPGEICPQQQLKVLLEWDEDR